MRNKIFYIFLVLAATLGITDSAHACTAGVTKTITVKEIGNEKINVCFSNKAFNWWTAFTWCQAQGYHLITWREACPTSAAGNTCSAWNGAGLDDPKRGWTAQTLNSDQAYTLELAWIYNPQYTQPKNRTATYRAICVMP